MNVPSQRRTFTLDDARQLLPVVRQMTEEAVSRAEALTALLEELPESDPDHTRLAAELNVVVESWAQRVRSLDVEVKGLWLVDFDNGHGYYCWRYPEEAVAHYHSYDDGFAGRMKIV